MAVKLLQTLVLVRIEFISNKSYNWARFKYKQILTDNEYYWFESILLKQYYAPIAVQKYESILQLNIFEVIIFDADLTILFSSES